MASVSLNKNGGSNDARRRQWGRVGTKVLLYGALTAYALLSILPLYVMLSSSVMKLGDVQSGKLWPDQDSWAAMVSGCLLFTNDTYVDADTGETVSGRRFLIDITEEAADRSGQGVRPSPVNYVERDEIVRVPFLTNYCMAWREANMGEYMLNTLIITTITITGLLAFAPLSAYAFARMEFPGKGVLFGVMLATLMVPEMVTNLPNFLIINKLGLV